MAIIISPLTVFVPKPSGLSYAKAMGQIRIWLDHKNMQPRSFKLAADFSRIGFEVSFQRDADLEAFDGFVWSSE
jgi:hypothetical protein